jgi:hypothetical protein
MSNKQLLSGSFVPSTQIWDVTDVYGAEIKDPKLQELFIRMYQNLNKMSIVLNVKDNGYYDIIQNSCSQLYFPQQAPGASTQVKYRPVLRLVVNFGALPNTSAKVVAHGITTSANTIFTRIYASASDTTGQGYIPIPYASPTLANNIELSVDGTNVTITTGSDRTNFTTCYVVLEYLQF